MKRSFEDIVKRAVQLGVTPETKEDKEEMDELLEESEEMFVSIITDLLKVQLKLKMNHTLEEIVDRLIDLELIDADDYVNMHCAILWFRDYPERYFARVGH